MATYRFCGHGITNNNGIATLDYDANGNPLQNSGLVGTGAGELDIMASLDDPTDINDSSLQSETYEVLDCIYYDGATTDAHTNYSGTNIGITFASDKYTATRSTTGNCYFQLNVETTTAYQGKTVKFEFNLVESDGNIYLEVYTKPTGGSFSRVVQTSAKTSGLIETTPIELASDVAQILFRVNCGSLGESQSCTFDSFKIYPV